MISITILARYADGAGADILIGLAIGSPLVLLAVGSVFFVRRARTAAIRAAKELSSQFPESRLILAEFDSRATRVTRRASTLLSQDFRGGLLVARIEPDRLSLFRPADLFNLGSLVVGVDIEKFCGTMINRSKPYNEPCLKVLFLDGSSVDVVLYDVSTGKWLDEPSLTSIESGF
ncbi:hypothetical protein [Microcella frigidaquae]|uniref:Uncharacterized protein n=1 Tax=Microcella frigidaquae TaxID=424758 RepID=A0A840X7G9_9MICO|nr:hypothetical protein [Microcella frigidaquae]MBB5617144.1 hypothetical protein [Microcella frigidaquae]NHN45853.1 hypothetical protein [Microcella frigidaquae]